jgi:hypothetical protein
MTKPTRCDEIFSVGVCFLQELPNVHETVYFILNNVDSSAILGKGAFGVVYRGIYLDRLVAIKTISVPNTKTSDANVYIRSMLAEIKVMIALAVPGQDLHSGKANVLALIGANTANINRGKCLVVKFLKKSKIVCGLVFFFNFHRRLPID